MKQRRHFTAIQKLVILRRAGYRCEICGVALTPETFHADHKIPYSLGGETAVYNAQALCAACNLKKGNRVE